MSASYFMNALTRAEQAYAKNQKTRTDNGALAYKTTGKELLDLNFKIPELRQMPEPDLALSWKLAYQSDPVIALRWLFYLRDVRGGLGERRSFNVMFNTLDPALQAKLISHRVVFGNGQNSESVPILAHYGRWKDMFQYFAEAKDNVKKTILETMKFQLGLDLIGISEGRGISYMGKWMPSMSANNSVRRHNAKIFAQYLGMPQKDYQEMISAMLAYLHVPEQQMSRREWDQIDFQRVPSAAMRIYKNAFKRHDQERFEAYIQSVQKGEAKIHSATLYPYQVLGDMMHAKTLNEAAIIEEQWKGLPPFILGDRSVLFVMDGSGSMTSTWASPIQSNKSITPWVIAAALTIKASETLKGSFKNKFITFSSSPRVVDLSPCDTLLEKIKLLRRYDDCSNTDIEKTMRLVLSVAVQNNLKQNELPDDIVIVSDMQFDQGTTLHGRDDDVLFNNIIKEFRSYGYTMPRVTFWNVSAMNRTIPLQTSPGGVTLVSGFSTNNYKIIATGELDPYVALKATVMDKRYDPVEEAFDEYCKEAGIVKRTDTGTRGNKTRSTKRKRDDKRAIEKALDFLNK